MSESVLVYGSDHSPWVQTVLLALAYRRIPYELVHFPISVSSYRKHGMVMPVCRWPDGAYTSDSFAILAEIDRRFPPVDMPPLIPPKGADPLAIVQSRLELFFVLYVLKRFDWGNKLRFIHAWAKTAPVHPQSSILLLSHVFRATMTLYFMLLIQGGIWSQTRKKKPIYTERTFLHEWNYWCDRLGDAPYLGGTHPSYLDFALLGQLQCISSGLTDTLFPVLRKAPPLMQWLGRMHQQLPGYRHMYSLRLLSDQARTIQTTAWGIFIFYLSLLLQLGLAPLMVIFLLHALTLRSKNPARTMGAMERTRKKNLPPTG